MLKLNLNLIKKNRDVIIRVCLVLMMVFVNLLPIELLELAHSLIGRIMTGILVAYLAYNDPLTSLLLSGFYVFSYHSLNRRIVGDDTNIITNVASEVVDKVVSELKDDDEKNIIDKVVSELKDVNVESVEEETVVEKDMVEDKHFQGYNNEIVYENSHLTDVPFETQHPSSKTLTDNIQLGNSEHRQLDVIQNNTLDAMANEDDMLVKGYDKLNNNVCKW